MAFAKRSFEYTETAVSRLAGVTSSAAPLMHDFSIWRLDTGTPARHTIQLCLCLRCGWMFKVDDRDGSITPLDEEGQVLAGAVADERITTFSSGPCPACSRLTTAVRLTQSVNALDRLSLRLVAVAVSVYRALVRQLWCRSPSIQQSI
jgi:hypothetical protein